MNRKIEILGKQISVTLVALLIMAGLGSAAVVSYLSNSVSVDVSVESPIELLFDDEGTNVTELSPITDINPPEPIFLKTYATNLADVSVDVYNVLIEVTAPAGTTWDGTEFTSVELYDPRYDGVAPRPGTDIVSNLCHVKSDGSMIAFSAISGESTNLVRLMYDTDCVPNTYTHPAGQTIMNEIKITPAAGLASGTYSIKMCHLNDLTGSCS